MAMGVQCADRGGEPGNGAYQLENSSSGNSRGCWREDEREHCIGYRATSFDRIHVLSEWIDQSARALLVSGVQLQVFEHREAVANDRDAPRRR